MFFLVILSAFIAMTLPSPRPTLFPYTTLFRSRGAGRVPPAGREDQRQAHRGDRAADAAPHRDRGAGRHALRSEEHTSELQSPCNLVCRLLLEKKKQECERKHIPFDRQ